MFNKFVVALEINIVMCSVKHSLVSFKILCMLCLTNLLLCLTNFVLYVFNGLTNLLLRLTNIRLRLFN